MRHDGEAPSRTRAVTISESGLAELARFLAIPSISADPEREGDVVAASDWIVELVRTAGGSAERLDWNGRPLVDAHVAASSGAADAPTILCYGHFDVQPPAPLELWESDPFAATVRDGWLYARGVADDKGQLWTLLHAALGLAREGSLPVNVRFCSDGEEEVGGSSIVEFLQEHAGSPAACVIFDTPMLDEHTHVFTTGARGTLYVHVEAKTGERDLHSGVYGGSASNALHVLTAALGRLVDGEGRLAEPLLADVALPLATEIAGWDALPAGRDLLAAQGAAEADENAAAEFYLRTWALPSLDVNGIEGGSPIQPKTIVVSEARANLSMRLAHGQRVERLFPILDALLRQGVPESAQLTVTLVSACDPGGTDPDAPALQVAADAFERSLGRRPLLLRSGGSLPIMPLLERLKIPAVVTGFAVPDANMHAPNERMRLSDLADAVRAARETFCAFGGLEV